MIDPEKFKKYREGETQQNQNLLAIPLKEGEQRQTFVIPRNRNPIIKDMESEILDMKEGGWNDLPDEQKAALRRQAWQR
jgi:hypothetical protein